MEVLLAWPLRMLAVMPRLLSAAPQGVMNFEFLEVALLGAVTQAQGVMNFEFLEVALLGAVTQAQAKADEIAKLMNENEHLKSLTNDKSFNTQVYALTRERDTLRREQNKRSDAIALPKEKDEITTQVMTKGEELSKKQGVQESTTRKLRAQLSQSNTITLESSSGGEPIARIRAYKSSSSKSDHISAIPGDQNCWKKRKGKDYNRPAQIIISSAASKKNLSDGSEAPLTPRIFVSAFVY
ncbi:hypothetical protein Tco_0174678 [Tanacetum coccineum]